MPLLKQSYIICCTPRSGSNLLADILTSTGVAGHPKEHFPRFSSDDVPRTSVQRDALVTQPPPESSYDPELDSDYVRNILNKGITSNGVFGINLHWFQLNDAIRRIQSYLGSTELTPHQTLSATFPNLSYLWLRRRDKVAQAVSWYKAIETGHYIRLRDRRASQNCQEPLCFDYDRISLYRAALASFDNGWNYYYKFNNLKPLVIYYEDICTDRLGAVCNIFEFLKLDASNISVGIPRHEKAGNEQSLQWAIKFRTMQDAIRKIRRV